MALYHQLKFPSTFIEYRSVSEWKGVVVISNFDSLEAAPFKSTALGRCLVCLGLNTPLPVRRGNKNMHSSTYYVLPSYLKYFWYYRKRRSNLGL